MSAAAPEYRALIIGATGACGTGLVRSLIGSPACKGITLLLRRPHPEADISSSSKVKQQIVDLDKMYESATSHARGHEAAFSCLGVGQPSKISKEEHYRVDVGLNEAFAKACKEAGVRYHAQLSAVAVDSSSHIYVSRIKGELEDKIKALGFPCAQIFAPAVILTPYDRYDTRWRIVSGLYKAVDCLLPSRFKSIYAADIGSAMRAGAEAFLAAPAGPPRFEHCEYAQMMAMAGKRP